MFVRFGLYVRRAGTDSIFLGTDVLLLFLRAGLDNSTNIIIKLKIGYRNDNIMVRCVRR